ncbi:MAG: hypothetical protein GX986_07940 [Firmicutes bacterium]|nr:hypothetical protein [Bacillota bacterium]
MALVTLIIAIIALALALWCVREILGLRERWARLYGLRSAMVETETTLQELMDELDRSGQALIAELDNRLSDAHKTPLGEIAVEKEIAKSPDSSGGLPSVGREASNEVEVAGKTKAVVNLARQGYTVKDIAKDLKLHQGEVQLILDLEQFRQ